jgi:hypothetical protein
MRYFMDLTPFKMQVVMYRDCHRAPRSDQPFGIKGIALEAIPRSYKGEKALRGASNKLLQALFPVEVEIEHDIKILVRWENDLRRNFWIGELALVDTTMPICKDIWGTHEYEEILWATDELEMPIRTITPLLTRKKHYTKDVYHEFKSGGWKEDFTAVFDELEAQANQTIESVEPNNQVVFDNDIGVVNINGEVLSMDSLYSTTTIRSDVGSNNVSEVVISGTPTDNGNKYYDRVSSNKYYIKPLL